MGEPKEQPELISTHSSIRRLPPSNKTEGPLSHLPFTVKDNISVRGFPTSWGFSPPAIPVATLTSPVVEKLLSEGALLTGMSNLDAGAIGASGKNLAYGEMKHASSTIPVFGSSGGGAIEVKKGETKLALVTDLSGSARIPALSAGVFGCKLRSSDISHSGVLRYHSTVDTLGLLANSLATLKSVMDFLLEERKVKNPRKMNPLHLMQSKHERKFFKNVNELFEELHISDFPKGGKLREIHRKLVCAAATKIYSNVDPTSFPEIAALLAIKKTEKVEQELKSLREKIADKLPKHSVFITPIANGVLDTDELPLEILLIANVLDWPAVVAPVNKKWSVHIMANGDTRSLIGWLDETLANSFS